MARTILHVDMDAFYAAVEQRDRAELRGKPVIVGADPKGGKGRGIVATASYEARRFGIHSAQPISTAWRLCPDGVYVRPNMEKYVRVSQRVIEILLGFTDCVEQVSIDEAFLDVTGSGGLYGSAREIAASVQARIRGELGLTASVGVAANKFVAKVASDLRKPEGLVVVEPGEERAFLEPLPVRRLWGVGPKTERRLLDAGVARIGDLARLEPDDLDRRLGEGWQHLWMLSRGLDDRPVAPEEGCRSLGHETTFEHDTSDRELLHATLLSLCEHLAERLRAHGLAGRTVALKFRDETFTTVTRRTTLLRAIDTSEEIQPVAERLLEPLLRDLGGKRVRLIGVYCTNLAGEGDPKQLGLFESPRRNRKLAAAVDAVTRRFGSGAITRATLLPPDERTRDEGDPDR